MEANGDGRLYFWHAFLVIAGYDDDISVFEASSLIESIDSRTYPMTSAYFIKEIKPNKKYWF